MTEPKTTEPKLELLIGRIPERKGVYLSERSGTVYRPLARFIDQESSERFLEIVKDHTLVSGGEA